MPLRAPILVATLALGASWAASTAPWSEHESREGERVDFGRDVRPILADRCFRCHGPDEGARKRGLRLDTQAGSRATLTDGERAIVPGDPKASALVDRITSDDPDAIMPPPSLGRPLTQRDKDVLARWIEQGAEYAPHWAFVPPRASAPPAVKEAAWCRDPLDRFVLARMEREGLAPAPEADRATLLRRASFVLTGLPPTSEEIGSFERDTQDGAYERQVDRLLASPRYGERMAADWLDVARFADTFGYQSDWENHAWPWRDGVIAAFNADLPYDQFVRDQIAGDLVPNATRAQIVASAFQRLHRMTNEGGSIDEEFRQEAIADRVATTSTAFLGLTVECARCHDHKYDPIEQRDFYSLGAFLGAIDEPGTYAYSHSALPPPTLRLSSAEQDKELARLAAKEREAEAELARVRRESQARFEAWLGNAPVVTAPAPVFRLPLDGAIEGPNAGSKATAFDGDTGIDASDVPTFRRCDPYSLAFWMRAPDAKERAVVLHTAPFTIESDPQGYQVLLDHGKLAWQVVHFWPGSAAAIATRAPFPVGRWVHVVVTYDGSSRANGMRIFLDGEPLETEVVRDALDGGATSRVFQLAHRDRDVGFASGALDELALYDRTLTGAEAAELFAPGTGGARVLARARGGAADAANELRVHWLRELDGEGRAAAEALRGARAAYQELHDALPELMVMRATPYTRPAFVLRRGRYDDPDPARPVRADRAIDALLPFDASWPQDRLGLARWMTDARNPLVARVEVNRLWAQCFGRGLVETQENFGLQGASPTHQKLLDALAVDFRADGWSVKRMLRRLVLSATFRQSSTSAASRERDPSNALLARGPSFRLSAEMLRDQALCASGLLVEKLGGPSAKPWQPPGLWEEAGATGSYTPDTGEGAHRRSLYTYRKRTAPPPNLTAFDAGSRETCLARRGATNTPLQALVLLNDPVFVECARELARRVSTERATTTERVELVFRRLASRAPRDAELATLIELHARETARFRGDEAACKLLLASERAEPELAALVLTASTLLAADATVVLR
ncbi:MAG: DUF1553 domain-containing protein [Planctomycetes bacterium]|nr:DUF1553 domain-containing protein [Planctomycetota bacterium]